MIRQSPAMQDRDQRKQDLLLASQLARLQAAGAFDEMAERADHVVERVVQVRALLANPLVQMAGAALVAFLVGVALRRKPGPRRGRLGARLVRWGWLGWRAWRISGPLLAAFRSGSAGAAPP